MLLDGFELFGEGNTREGVAILECAFSYIRNVTPLTEYHTHEIITIRERKLRNALKFRQSGEVYSKEGVAPAEGLLLPPPNCNEVVTPQEELNGTVGEALIQQPNMQFLRTKLIFDVRIDYQFLD